MVTSMIQLTCIHFHQDFTFIVHLSYFHLQLEVFVESGNLLVYGYNEKNEN